MGHSLAFRVFGLMKYSNVHRWLRKLVAPVTFWLTCLTDALLINSQKAWREMRNLADWLGGWKNVFFLLILPQKATPGPIVDWYWGDNNCLPVAPPRLVWRISPPMKWKMFFVWSDFFFALIGGGLSTWRGLGKICLGYPPGTNTSPFKGAFEDVFSLFHW